MNNATVSIQNDVSILALVFSADVVVQSVIFVLLISSLWSWAIIFDKYFKCRSISKKIRIFEGTFWSVQVLDHLYERARKSNDNPLSIVFVAAMNEFRRGERNKLEVLDSVLKIGLKDRVFQAMNLVRNREIESLEGYLGFLATVGSVTPFIGLFGTVWGIMHSFQSIAISKNTSLAVVAPGIAESLLVTAVGLLAAIPAMMFYNFLTSQINAIGSKIEDFICELHTILSRAIDEEKN